MPDHRRALAAALLAVALATLAGIPAAVAQPTTAGPRAQPTTLPPTTLPPTTLPPTTAPPTTLPPTTASPTTAPPATAAPTTVPATDAPTTAPAATSGPGATIPAGGAGTPGATPAAGEPGVEGAASGPGGPAATGSRDVIGELVRGNPVEAARKAVESAVRELRDLSAAELVLFGLLALFALALTAAATTTLWWMLHAWRTPASLAATGFPTTGDRATEHSFSLIVPARHEQAVLGATLERLAGAHHPNFEVLAVVGDDDPDTLAVAEDAAARHPDRIRVLVDSNQPKNKPRALNTALPACAGMVTAVFDAEDEVHPELLRHVDARFADTGADIVQGGVQLMNYHSSWYSLRNVLEYYFWFRSRLHFHARQRFIPLGGNTVFIRTDRLREAGGWDPDCLAEDCEIGVRLSSRGAKVAVAYDPDLVTREETPGTVRELFRQRTRWNQGFLQVLRKGEWRRLPTARQRLLARYTLAQPFLQAFAAVLIPVSLATMILLDMPVLAALLTFVPLVPTLATLAVEAAAIGEFCRSYGRRATPLDYLRLLLGTFPYHLLLGAAALRAVLRERRGERGWEKTAHVGAHRQTGAGQAVRRAP
jgi:cellulose synthase/poly-beta-1,6-N-acetylglucosamine synthase-like glycosyltransferase